VFENRYIEALKSLIAEKQKKKGKRVIQDASSDAPTKGSNVIDLMAALKKSLDSAPAKLPPKPAAKKEPAKKPAPAKAQAGVTMAKVPLDIETYNKKRDFKKTAEPRGRKLKARATASSSRSMTPRASIGISGSSSTEC
jgi:hypothetical protein